MSGAYLICSSLHTLMNSATVACRVSMLASVWEVFCSRTHSTATAPKEWLWGCSVARTVSRCATFFARTSVLLLTYLTTSL